MADVTKIEFEGRVWSFEMKLSMQQGIVIETAYGFTLSSWLEALQAESFKALHVLYWLMLQQNGEKTALKDADCDVIELAVAWRVAAGDEDAEPEPDPTQASSSLKGSAASPMSGTPRVTTRPQPAGEVPATG